MAEKPVNKHFENRCRKNGPQEKKIFRKKHKIWTQTIDLTTRYSIITSANKSFYPCFIENKMQNAALQIEDECDVSG